MYYNTTIRFCYQAQALQLVADGDEAAPTDLRSLASFVYGYAGVDWAGHPPTLNVRTILFTPYSHPIYTMHTLFTPSPHLLHTLSTP